MKTEYDKDTVLDILDEVGKRLEAYIESGQIMTKDELREARTLTILGVSSTIKVTATNSIDVSRWIDESIGYRIEDKDPLWMD